MSFLITMYAQQQPDPCSLTTLYGLRFYEEGLFSSPTNFSSSNPSFPDLARWRHTLENIPETTDINRTLLLFPCSNNDHALMTSSAGWRHWLKTAHGPRTCWRTALETHHTSEPQWPVVLYAARRFNSTVELVYDVTTETCPALWRITGGEMSSQCCPCSGDRCQQKKLISSKNLALSVLYFLLATFTFNFFCFPFHTHLVLTKWV